MSRFEQASPRLQTLLQAACREDATEEDLAELEDLACDESALCLMADYLQMDGELHRIYRQESSVDRCLESLGIGAQRMPVVLRPDAPVAPPSLLTREPFGVATGYFSSGWPVAYFVAAVIFAIGLTVAAVVHVSAPSQMARPATPVRASNPQSPIPNPFSVVARITGMVDCVWEGSGFRIQGSGAEDQKSEIRNQKSFLRLGDCLALKSGLLEITYETGAKLILQGPVTYEVESPAGGYLRIGKLTARLEKRSGIRGQRSEVRDQKFVVRTPTAVVTDLGTEFGVEVSENGDTTSHVFRGLVEVQLTASDGERSERTVRLTEHESVHIAKRLGRMEMDVRRNESTTSTFVRAKQLSKLVLERRLKPFQRWQAYSQQLRKDPALVAYYTFESAGKDSATLPNLSVAGSVLDGQIDGAEWVHGRWPKKLALLFHGWGTNNKVVLPEQQRFNFGGPFSIAVWCQTMPFPRDSIPSLIAKGGSCWRVQRYGNDTQNITVDTSFMPPGGKDFSLPQPHVKVGDGRWHLVVVVIEPDKHRHHKRIYVDGQMDGEVTVPLPLLQNQDPVWLGMSPTFADRDWNGRIDEVAILARAMSAEEAVAMFEAGNPAANQGGD